jgi:hypothetical protein
MLMLQKATEPALAGLLQVDIRRTAGVLLAPVLASRLQRLTVIGC